MSLYRFQHIQNWTEADLQQLPVEDGSNEYKSSRTKDDDLGNKISIAASAFWNSGGGIFIAGVDNATKQIDGGIDDKVGRQTRSDWVDKQLKKTQPAGTYWLREISPDPNLPVSLIQPRRIVLVIGFEESANGPHMAYDGTYRVRAGSHSEPASHFLVEAIRAQRAVQTPILRAVLRRSKRSYKLVDLVFVVLNDAAALDVQINFDPMPLALGKYHRERFPLNIPLIDRQHPFHLELYYWGGSNETFGKTPVLAKVSFKDLLGRSYEYEQLIDISNSIDPMQLGESDLQKIEIAIKELTKKIGLNRDNPDY